MENSVTVTSLQTQRNAINQTRLATAGQALPLADGEVLLKLDRVAITTNNLTYAALGDAMQYWDFFPTGDADWGHMPAWGFAEVAYSAAPGVQVGERFYGYFPIADYVKMRPKRITPRGFYDGSEHRLALISAYNQYMRCSQDTSCTKADEDVQTIVRPLFITSFMAADFLQDNQFFGARQIVVSSASSKTAYGTAYCLQQQNGVSVIALTSSGNRAFVEHLGCYRQSVAYAELARIAHDVPTLYLDFSGDENLRAEVHQYFGAALVYDCFIGSTQHVGPLRDTGLSGPAPTMFFAPSQIKKRNADWGHDVFNQRFGVAQQGFIARIGDAADPWLRIVQHHGLAAAPALIEALFSGRSAPLDGHVVVID